ncbi:DUF6928 family protein [Actinocorallia herbida]|uniref:DUF6928 family protein n=1 Tax=Actinocorallia herbida TaxID=58109 RepID=UPI000F4C418D|nr:hypothetical protein [Actinocorallia herbida]
MGWSVALACASSGGDPGRVFRPGLEPDGGAALDLARRLYPAASVEATGETVLDFALWPYEDEVFIGAYPGGLAVCDRRLFQLDDDARRVADTIATELPGADCGVLVLHERVGACWFRWYSGGALVRDIYVTADDGVVVDQGERLPAEAPFWKAIDGGASDVPLPFGPEEFGLELARACLFGRELAGRGADGFLPLELPLRRFRLA